MSAPDPASRKRELRERFRTSRKKLDSATRAAYDRRMGQQLVSRYIGQPGVTLGAFLAFDGEPDLEPALRELRDQGARIALPVLRGMDPPSMSLKTWTESEALRANRMGIREPVDGELIELNDIDVLLMPLVAYDSHGVRLGVGGGYYDRLLAHRSSSAGPVRVGVAYSLQQSPALPRESWDVPLDAILNENGWFSFPL